MRDALLVPIDLEVMLVNGGMKASNAFRLWNYTYASLGDGFFSSPEPAGFDNSIPDLGIGAHLHWTLPRSLRSSRQGTSTGYPLVPNRWLVVRIARSGASANAQRAWVIESDCPNETGAASGFLVGQSTVDAWANSPEPKRRNATPQAISTGVNASLTADTKTYTIDIGHAFAQAEWAELAEPGNLFLTAIAPGNLEFSAYVHFNQNVFSFYDDLGDAPASATLSYFVAGWYSDPTCDIANPDGRTFTGETTASGILAALNWTVASSADAGAVDRSVYSGMAFGLGWDDTDGSSAPSPDQLADIRDTANMTVAVANTGVDAFSTLVGEQLAAGHDTPTTLPATIQLLRAFHYDLLPVLNQVNGDALLEQRVRQEWFNGKPGGTRWTITAKPPVDGATKPDPKEAAPTPAEAAWLLQLNLDQAEFDHEMAQLHSLQWDLSAAWWRLAYYYASQYNLDEDETRTGEDKLKQELDEARGAVLTALARIDGLLDAVPRPVSGDGIDAQAAFVSGAAVFAARKGIGDARVLKAVAQPRYWKPNNPSILISGVQPSAAMNPDDSLVVRVASQRITALKAGGTTVAASSLGKDIVPGLSAAPTPGKGVPPDVQALYEEFFLLDPSNAPRIAADAAGLDASSLASAMREHDPGAYDGVLPAGDLGAWSQRWHPLYLEWEVTYTDVPFEWNADPAAGDRGRTCNWTFNGTDYDLVPSPSGASDTRTIRGRSLLSPHTQFTFGGRLRRFLDQFGGEGQLKDLYADIDRIDDWKFLTQELVNFGELLTQRDARSFRRPTVEAFADGGATVTYAKVVGYPDETSRPPYDTPASGQGLIASVPAIKFDGPSPYPFHGIRSARCFLSHLIVYDQFGRILDLIDPGGSAGVRDATTFPLVCDAALAPSAGTVGPAVRAPFQLPPRLLQACRLDALLVDQRDRTKVLGLAKDVNPVSGWVLANHLDHSLMVYAPDGSAAGELELIQGVGGTARSVQWSAPPHDPAVRSVDDIAASSPYLAAFVNALRGRSEAEFEALLGAIDSTLWTVDPLGDRTDRNLSVLIGRPLALVGVRLQFRLDGAPLKSCEWSGRATPDRHQPDFTTSRFSIRLGDQASRQDGVIGYFEADDYTVFNAVAKAADEQSYVRQIGPLAGGANYIALPFDGTTTATVTLLVDPRASIHATTGILPVKELTLPAQFVDRPLARLNVTFRVGPLLSRLRKASTAGGLTPPFTDVLSYLPISEKGGTWSWWEAITGDSDQDPSKPAWQGYGLVNASTNASLDATPATLREGRLQFVADLGPKNDR